MSPLFSLLPLLFTSWCYVPVNCFTAYEEQDHGIQLEKYLLSLNNSKTAIPVKNAFKPVTVQIEMFPTQLIALDGTQQTLTLSSYLRFVWNDERITWNPANFGGVNTSEIFHDEIWYPKVFLYNGVGSSQLIVPTQPLSLTSLSPNLTRISYATKRNVAVSCTQDLQKFPNDTHTCEILFLLFDDARPFQLLASSMFDASNKNYSVMYITSNEWALTDLWQGVITDYRKGYVNSPPMPIQFYAVRLTFHRIFDYYMYTMIVPLLLLTVLQVLVFFVPIESGEKMSLGITILLSFTVFLLILDNIIPKTKEMPQITYFITYSMVLSAVTLVLSGLLMRMYFVEANVPMSNCLQAFFIRGLARAMCIPMPRSVYQSRSSVSVSNEDVKQEKGVVVEEDAEEAAEDVNLWKIAAMALEKVLFYLGIVMVIGISCGFLIPPFV